MAGLLPEIETVRLTLRAIEVADAPALARNMTPAVTRWLASWPDPMTEAIALDRIEQSRAAMQRGGHFFYAVVRRADGRVIGGFMGKATADDPQRMEIAYHLSEDCQGQGYMREAGLAVLPAIWRLAPSVQVLEAGAQLANDASFNIMRALGMTPGGERQVYAAARGRYEPCLFFELRRAA
jgi:RimJ/RimL family protein N-acetyltransferase